ncbi:MAG: class I SAM-dependent methyltransferase [Verrucomicrobia bacterium]|nr:class I SAM-dependent methyltransferase [Verrucomicrobiota bacterium]
MAKADGARHKFGMDAFTRWRRGMRALVRGWSWRPSPGAPRTGRVRLECDAPELGRFVWHRLLPVVETSPYPPHELMLMCAVVVHLRPDVIVEWGTHLGVSARVFHEVAQAYGVATQVHSIDLPPGVAHAEHPGDRRGLLVRHLPVTLHEGDGPVVAQALLRHARNPLVFIDGDHRYESVLRDGRLVLQAAPNAALLFHDTFFQPGSGYNHGPHDSIRVLLREFGREDCQVIEAALGLPGLMLVMPRG